jgi:hypothetical protein
MKVTYKQGKRRNPDEIVTSLRRVAQQTADLVREDYEKVVDNWNTKVDFSVENNSDQDLRFNIYASGVNADIFMYVDRGTDRRYAVMHRSFVSRTRPGSLYSNASGGNRAVAYFDYEPARAAARGIVAREFGKSIVQNRLDTFLENVKAAMKA